MMDQEIKKDWVAALRSGEYQQATGALKTADGHCCLGVLCDLAVKRGVVSEDQRDDGTYIYGEEEKYADLPDAVVQWAGLTSSGPGVDVDPNHDFVVDSWGLISLNDDYNWTFSQIADAIEEQL